MIVLISQIKLSSLSWLKMSFFEEYGVVKEILVNVYCGSIINNRTSNSMQELVYNIWAASSEKLSSNLCQNAQIQIILRMLKVSSDFCLSIHTIYGIQWFCYGEMKALIRQRGYTGWSGLSLSACARGHVFLWRCPYVKLPPLFKKVPCTCKR